MHAGTPALGPADMQAPSGEVDVVPAQCHQLRGPEAVAVSDQDSRGVPMPRAVLLGGLNKPLDLPVGRRWSGTRVSEGLRFWVGAARLFDFQWLARPEQAWIGHEKSPFRYPHCSIHKHFMNSF
jgi:pyridoxine/pyridoxamine 5'-phosphate oxidase